MFVLLRFNATKLSVLLHVLPSRPQLQEFSIFHGRACNYLNCLTCLGYVMLYSPLDHLKQVHQFTSILCYCTVQSYIQMAHLAASLWTSCYNALLCVSFQRQCESNCNESTLNKCPFQLSTVVHLQRCAYL